MTLIARMLRRRRRKRLQQAHDAGYRAVRHDHTPPNEPPAACAHRAERSAWSRGRVAGIKGRAFWHVMGLRARGEI